MLCRVALPVPGATPLGARHVPPRSGPRAAVVPRGRVVPAAFNDMDSGADTTAMLEAAVPQDQRPVNELAQLKADLLYSWGQLELNEYIFRLGGVFAFFTALVGGPIAYQTFEPSAQPVEWILSASVGSLVVVAIVVVRIFLGWSYVSDRLLSAAYPYEETGWYDGQMFVKPPELLTRDRLLGMYETKPVLQKLKSTLIGSGLILLTTSVVLFGLIKAETDSDGMYGRGAARGPRQVTQTGLIFSQQVSDLSVLREDDELASKEAEALGGIPGYCYDRYLRAAAGGGLCEKFNDVTR